MRLLLIAFVFDKVLYVFDHFVWLSKDKKNKIKIINDKYKINGGHIETVHSYTNDQNLIDNFHKGDRRGRSAALNMVLTTTGAVNAVAKAIPELEGKLTGNAIRVPTPNVSLAKLTFGVGTRIALPVSLPSSSGIALATALTAPVVVKTIFNAALLPLLSPL